MATRKEIKLLTNITDLKEDLSLYDKSGTTIISTYERNLITPSFLSDWLSEVLTINRSYIQVCFPFSRNYDRVAVLTLIGKDDKGNVGMDVDIDYNGSIRLVEVFANGGITKLSRSASIQLNTMAQKIVKDNLEFFENQQRWFKYFNKNFDSFAGMKLEPFIELLRKEEWK